MLKIKNKRLLKAVFSVFMVVVICLATMGSVPIKVYSAYIDPALEKVLSRAADTDLIPVDIWLYEIDTEEVDEKVFAKTGLSRETISDEKRSAQLTHAEVDAYIEAERTLYAEAQTKQSQAFLDKHSGIFTSKATADSEIFYVSKYAPSIQMELTPDQIAKLAKDLAVESIYYSPEMKLTDYSDISFTATRAKYARDTLGLTGSGIKIGMIEQGVPNVSQPYFADSNIFYNSYVPSSHADLVASIMVASSYTANYVTYEGIVPEATLYSTPSSDTTQDRTGIEWLLSQGVNVINMSAGVENSTGIYCSHDRWKDHVVYQHNVHFVVAAGNNGLTNGYVVSPALAYNVIAVGNYYDNNNLRQTDDIIASDSSYFECGITESSQEHPMKPDLVAPGTSITTAATELNPQIINSGTSFAAPHVTGIVAQLCQADPILKTKPATMKAILTASINHLKHRYVPDGSNDDEDEDEYEFEYDIYGAGVVNAYESYRTIVGDQFISSSFPAGTARGTIHAHSFTLSSAQTTMRISLSWLNPIYIDGNHNSDYTDNEYKMAKLNLRIYDSNNNLLETCVTTNNVQIIELSDLSAGTYTVKITYYIASSETINYGLAWSIT